MTLVIFLWYIPAGLTAQGSLLSLERFISWILVVGAVSSVHNRCLSGVCFASNGRCLQLDQYRILCLEGSEYSVHRSHNDIVSEVLAATDIVEVVGGHLELKPSGAARFKALCPFHSEKTASFTINRDRQAFYCFGCEKHGDAITFLREIEGLNFREALQKLADRAGIDLPAFTGNDSRGAQRRTQMIDLGKGAARLYRDRLLDPTIGEPGRRYLQTRHLREETVERFGLGYAPEGWSTLIDFARRRNIPDSILQESGLAKQGQRGRPYDFFRNRLIFPIKDVTGNTVAFGGRDLGDGPAKYINSSESPIYKKGRVLYGLNEAREAMRKAKSAILVEGYFDLLRCFDAGIENVVATCGTALTSEQATLIRRYVPEILVVYDGDPAGVRAALRSVGILVAAGLTVRALTLPDGQDPDDYVLEHGADAFKKLAVAAQGFVSFYVQMNQARTRTIEGRTDVAKELFAILSNIDDVLRIDEYLKLLAEELGLHLPRCREEFAKFMGEKTKRPTLSREAHSAPVHVNPHDRDFVAVLMADATLLAKAHQAMDTIDLPAGPIAEVVEALSKAGLSSPTERLEDEEAQALYAAAANAKDTWGDAGEQLVEERIAAFTRGALRAKAERIQEEIDEAQRLHDDAKVNELFTRKVSLEKAIRQAGVV